MEDRSRRHSGLGLLMVYSCLFLACAVFWDSGLAGPAANADLKSWPLLCVSAVGWAWGGKRSPSSFRGKSVLAQRSTVKDNQKMKASTGYFFCLGELFLKYVQGHLGFPETLSQSP